MSFTNEIRNIGMLIGGNKNETPKLYYHECEGMECRVVSICKEPCRYCGTKKLKERKQ